jgi:ABC-type transporter Mla MlaB component
MSPRNETKISWEIYHRIYRFAVKNVDAQSIASTLNLPIKTVSNILERFHNAGKSSPTETEAPSPKKSRPKANAEIENQPEGLSFLDVYLLSKARYAILDLSGMVTSDHLDKLQKELNHLASSSWKAVALLMADVVAIDDMAMAEIIKFQSDFHGRGRYVGLLNPSPAIEPFIEKNKIDEKIPIFGTEKVFEENAFSFTKSEGKKTLK